MPLVAEAVSHAALRRLVPPLTASSYKGQAGKVAVVGGCFEYTGAPFYAAISALKLGMDLSHVFCEEAAAVPIKSYSPELIVHGCLRAGPEVDAAGRQAQAEAVTKWFPAITALVVGPGLGRDETLQAVAELVVQRAIADGLPCVLDADGLALVLRRPELVRGSRWTVITPNKPEFGRLVGQLLPEAARGEADEGALLEKVCAALDGPVVVRKGPSDVICDGATVLACEETGSLKRSGGQGDVLSGTIASLLSWAKASESQASAEGPSAQMLAAYAGCLLTRRFSRAAFARHGRSMTAPDLVSEIGAVFAAFEAESP